MGWITEDSFTIPVYMQSSYMDKTKKIESLLYFYKAVSEERLQLTEAFHISHEEKLDFFTLVKAHQLPLLLDKRFIPVDLGDITTRYLEEYLGRDFEAYVAYPRGGTLVLFDSVSVPHSVDVTLRGSRVAIGGWWHERTAKLRD